MTAAVGRLVVGGYELGERIGSGRLGQVYRAAGATGPLAIKLLSPDAELDDPAAVARFRHEVAALAAVRHDNVVALIDHGVDDELGPYLVMPLVEGRTLRAIIAEGTVEPVVAALAMRELAAGIAAIHRAGLVHRDLKPENIIVRDDGCPVILDLGLAWTETQTRHTEEGAIAGSVPYMAPEQIDGGTPTPATDLWALAVITHEWVTGSRPFARPRQSEEVAAILAGQFEPLARRDLRVDPALGALVDRCLAAGPRPRDGTELHQALAAMVTGDAGEALRDPAAASARVAASATAALLGEARGLLARGKTFAAAERLERAAAHRPDDPAVLSLVDEVGRAPARRRTRWLPWVALAAVAGGALGAAMLVTRGGGAPSAAVAVEPDAAPAPIAPADVPETAPADRSALARLVHERTEPLVHSDHVPSLGYPFGRAPEVAAASEDAAEHEAYARALLAGTQRARGVAFLEASLRRFPDDAALWHLSGLVSKRTGAYDDADRAFSRALSIDADRVETLRERGELRRLRGQLRDAFVDLARARQLAPDDVGVLGNLVQVHVAAGRAAEARAMARRAVELAPDKAQPRIDLASVSPDSEAIEILHHALRLEPRSEAAQKALCVVSARLALPQAEDHCFKAGIGPINNKDPDIVLATVAIHVQRGDLGRAYLELTNMDHDLRLVLKRLELAEAASYGFAVPEIRARACALGHAPSCAAADTPGTD